MRSLFKIVVVIVNIAGSDDDVDGWDVTAMWISVKAATVFATTFKID